MNACSCRDEISISPRLYAVEDEDENEDENEYENEDENEDENENENEIMEAEKGEGEVEETCMT